MKEYKLDTITKDYEPRLNELAEDGWELKFVLGGQMAYSPLLFVFEREKKAPDKPVADVAEEPAMMSSYGAVRRSRSK